LIFLSSVFVTLGLPYFTEPPPDGGTGRSKKHLEQFMSSALHSAMLSLASWSLRLSVAGCQASRRSIATVVSGNKTSKLVRERLKKDVEKMKSQFSGFRPSLVVLQVGDRDDSNLYISTKLKAAAEVRNRI
ncbi:hypothetical protein XENOCAPTIV_021230, partial [Xenoophorus captivus]